MPHGIIIIDEETAGTWRTVGDSQTQILMSFDAEKQCESFIGLAEEHGAAISFLTWDSDPTQP